MNRTHKKQFGKSVNAELLSPQEWCFDTVPDDEIGICLLYEYGRERVKNSKRWRQSVRDKEFVLAREFDSVFSKAEMLPWFCCAHFADTPWQSVDKKLRAKKARDFNSKDRGNFREYVCLRITLERDLFPERAKSKVTNFEAWTVADQCFHRDTDQREYGYFAINWNYTDGQLKDEFVKWLAKKRGDRKDIENRKGKEKFRQYLKALGAKRLLDSGLTVAEAIGYTEKVLKNKDGNPRPLYDSDRGWSKAKNETVPTVLEQLFSSQQVERKK